jgi:hypothetical protein
VAKLISSPSLIEASGNVPKVIEEFIGNVNSGNGNVKRRISMNTRLSCADRSASRLEPALSMRPKARPSSLREESGFSTAPPDQQAPNMFRSASPRFPSTPCTGMLK